MSYLVVLDYTNDNVSIYNDEDINPTNNPTFNYDEWLETHFDKCVTAHIICDTINFINVPITMKLVKT